MDYQADGQVPLATMRRVMNSAADQNLFVDTRATGHLLNAPQG